MINNDDNSNNNNNNHKNNHNSIYDNKSNNHDNRQVDLLRRHGYDFIAFGGPLVISLYDSCVLIQPCLAKCLYK